MKNGGVIDVLDIALLEIGRDRELITKKVQCV